MVRIKLLDGETVETHLYTAEEVNAAKADGREIVVGGLGDADEFEKELGGHDGRPHRIIFPEAIGSVEEVPA